MIADWLLIVIAVLTLWALWGIFNIAANCIEYWQAARRGEDLYPRGERGD